jgi:hypothetical protein
MNTKEEKVIDGEYEPKTIVVATPFRFVPPIDKHDIEVIRPSKKAKKGNKK